MISISIEMRYHPVYQNKKSVDIGCVCLFTSSVQNYMKIMFALFQWISILPMIEFVKLLDLCKKMSSSYLSSPFL